MSGIRIPVAANRARIFSHFEREIAPKVGENPRSSFQWEKILARLLVDDLGKPDVEGVDLGTAELCRTRLVARHGSAIAQDINIGKAHMAGHGAHLAAVSVKVKDVARLVTMVAATRTQLVHAAHADTRTLATRRAERLVLARRLDAALASITHGQSHPGRPRWAGRQTYPPAQHCAR